MKTGVAQTTMNKKIMWRLATLPAPDEIRNLVNDGILTKEEARQILFSEQEDTGGSAKRDTKSYQTEIAFLRELVEKLASNRTTIVETIRSIETPYKQSPWLAPYTVWCSSGYGIYGSGGTAGGTTYTVGTAMGGGSSGQLSFSSIKTF